MFGLGRKKKKKKKAQRAAEASASAAALTEFISGLEKKQPAIEKDILVKKLLGFVLPKEEAKIRKEITPTYEEAERKGVALVSVTPGTVPEAWKSFFAKKREEEVSGRLKELTPKYVENLSQFLGELYKPEVAVTTGLALTAPQWLGREWYTERPRIESMFAQAKEQYNKMLEATANYLKELGIEEITAEQLLRTIWNV